MKSLNSLLQCLTLCSLPSFHDLSFRAQPSLAPIPEGARGDSYETSQEHRNFLTRLTQQRLSIHKGPENDVSS